MSEVPEKDDDQVLAGEYALGLLSVEEAKAFEARLASEPDLRAAYTRWAEDFALLAEEIPEETPPARVKAALDHQLYEEARPARRGLFERFGLAGLAAAALVAALFLVVELPGSGVQPPKNPIYHADLATDEGEIILAAGYDPEATELYVERRGVETRPGRAIELWLIAGENPPVSLGVLPEDARIRLPMSENLVQALEGGVLAISDEPEGGSPTGAPTGDILATGALENV